MKSLLEGKSVLVTGADGFIGSHLTEHLVKLGARTRAFCLYNSNGSTGWLEQSSNDIKAEIEIKLGDIRDARFVEDACKGIDIVFHLAALIAIPYSYSAPQSFIETNVLGTLNVLEGVRRADCERIIQTSTSEVYGTPDSVPIKETHPLHGQSPYSASKIAADMLCESYYCTFDVPVTTLRPFNTYGPRQSTRAILPTILTQLIAGKKEVSLGNLKPRRDLTYVTDTVEGFVCAATATGIEGEAIQLGTGTSVSIEQLFNACCEALETQATVIQDKKRLRPDKGEVMDLLSDPDRALKLLGWKPQVSLVDGLRRTADWLRENIHNYDTEHYHV